MWSVSMTAVIILLLQFVPEICHGLQCMCSETASLPPAECALDLQCEVSNGVCYQQIYRDEYGQYTRWGCYDYDLGGGLGALVGACEISNQDTRVRCCNDSDLCNRKLTIQPFPERMSLPTQVNTPNSKQSDSKEGGLKLVLILPLLLGALVLVLVVIFISAVIGCFWRVKCLRQQIAQKMDADLTSYGSNEAASISCTQSTICDSRLLTKRQLAHDINLIKKKGHGQHTQVYLGEYQSEKVAVKIFPKNATSERAWLKETSMYTSYFMQHENVLAYIASDVVNLKPMEHELWLVTHYHENGCLQEYLLGHTVTLQEVFTMARSLCSALAYLHSDLQTKPPIAHCSITSKSVLLKSNMQCCVSEFTLAMVESSLPLSLVDFQLGSPRYLPPEVLSGSLKVVDKLEPLKKVDVYATGLLLWEVLNRCSLAQHSAGEYEVPYQGLVPPDPSFEEMKRCVVVERRQPTIPAWWGQDELLGDVVYMLKECWYGTANARPTAVYMKKKMIKALSQRPLRNGAGDREREQHCITDSSYKASNGEQGLCNE